MLQMLAPSPVEVWGNFANHVTRTDELERRHEVRCL